MATKMPTKKHTFFKDKQSGATEEVGVFLLNAAQQKYHPDCAWEETETFQC
jgi:hypothetical protein